MITTDLSAFARAATSAACPWAALASRPGDLDPSRSRATGHAPTPAHAANETRFAVDPTAFHMIFDAADGRLLQGADSADGRATLASLTGRPVQQWNLAPAPGVPGVHRIVNRDNGLVLESRGGEVGVGRWNGGPDQLWSLTFVGGTYRIVGLGSGLPLEASDALRLGAERPDDPRQRWSIVQVAP